MSSAGEISTPAATASPCDDLWSHAILYQNKDNPIIQEFSLQGRFQVQYAVGSSDQGDFSSGDLQDLGLPTWEDIDMRRWHLGFNVRLLNQFKLQCEILVNPDWDPFYSTLHDLFVNYKFNEQLQFNAGKAQVKFTKEYEVSNREIVTLERSLLINQLNPGLLTGVWVKGKNVTGPWFYEMGIYAADIQPEFTEFAGGALMLGKLGYDLGDILGLDEADVALHWMHSTEPNIAGAKGYGDAIAIAAELKHGPWGATGDIIYGLGDGTSPDVWGFSAIPTYDLTEKLQIAMRYQVASSDGDNGLRLQTRYEHSAGDFLPAATDGTTKKSSGNFYQAIYLGLNYYIYGHKLKLMTGIEYADMQDDAKDDGEFEGWTWTSGLRMCF